jgi:hypothetical protein
VFAGGREARRVPERTKFSEKLKTVYTLWATNTSCLFFWRAVGSITQQSLLSFQLSSDVNEFVEYIHIPYRRVSLLPVDDTFPGPRCDAVKLPEPRCLIAGDAQTTRSSVALEIDGSAAFWRRDRARIE